MLERGAWSVDASCGLFDDTKFDTDPVAPCKLLPDPEAMGGATCDREQDEPATAGNDDSQGFSEGDG